MLHNFLKRLSVELMSWLCGGQSICENDFSCSRKHALSRWILALSSWNMDSGMSSNMVVVKSYKAKVHQLGLKELMPNIQHARNILITAKWFDPKIYSIFNTCLFYLWSTHRYQPPFFTCYFIWLLKDIVSHSKWLLFWDVNCTALCHFTK